MKCAKQLETNFVSLRDRLLADPKVQLQQEIEALQTQIEEKEACLAKSAQQIRKWYDFTILYLSALFISFQRLRSFASHGMVLQGNYVWGFSKGTRGA